MPSSGCQTCALDRKSTRLNSSHTIISYAVFCLKKKDVLISCLTPASASQRSARTLRIGTQHTSIACRHSSARHASCCFCQAISPFFFFNDTATTEIYTLSLHDALPISQILDLVHVPDNLPPAFVGYPRLP